MKQTTAFHSGKSFIKCFFEFDEKRLCRNRRRRHWLDGDIKNYK